MNDRHFFSAVLLMVNAVLTLALLACGCLWVWR